MTVDPRAAVRAMMTRATEEGRPLGWFEELYLAAARGEATVPWADGVTNPWLASWLADHAIDGRGKKALVVGCGYGDDAIELVRRGFEVTAFDLAPTAIAAARVRPDGAGVTWVVADAAAPPAEWAGRFDLVVEIYTLQAVPTELRGPIAAALPGLVAPGGSLLVIGRLAGEGSTYDGPPWPMPEPFVRGIGRGVLAITAFEVLEGSDDLPGPRVRARFERPAATG